MERGVWRAGNWIAGASGAALLISLFLPWYGMFTGIVCVQAPCPTFSFASGWQALGVEAALLVGAAGLGLALPGSRWRRPAQPSGEWRWPSPPAPAPWRRSSWSFG